jgi:hypothetical protein
VLRKMVGRKAENAAKDRIITATEKLHNLCTSPKTIMAIKSTRIEWVGM